MPEPFQRLVNQGMILGETEYYITPASFEANKAALQTAGIEAVFRKNEDEAKREATY